MRACWQCKRVFDLFLAGEGLTGTDSHLNITSPAECAACDGDGNAKQCHKGKGKEKVTGHAAPLSFCGKHPVMNEQ
jgi:hypothetical protein